MYEKLQPPSVGSKITFVAGKPVVPNDPIIPYIRGDCTGVDIWHATELVINSAIAKDNGGERKFNWFKL